MHPYVYTTLAETSDRILATSLIARWRYESPVRLTGWGEAYAQIRQIMLKSFATVHSLALQQPLSGGRPRPCSTRPTSRKSGCVRRTGITSWPTLAPLASMIPARSCPRPACGLVQCAVQRDAADPARSPASAWRIRTRCRNGAPSSASSSPTAAASSTCTWQVTRGAAAGPHARAAACAFRADGLRLLFAPCPVTPPADLLEHGPGVRHRRRYALGALRHQVGGAARQRAAATAGGGRRRGRDHPAARWLAHRRQRLRGARGAGR